jgi:hypothetical protein
MLHVNPKMLARLDELEADLLNRRARAEAEGWIGEIEGIDLTLTFSAPNATTLNAVVPVQSSTSGCLRWWMARRSDLQRGSEVSLGQSSFDDLDNINDQQRRVHDKYWNQQREGVNCC